MQLLTIGLCAVTLAAATLGRILDAAGAAPATVVPACEYSAGAPGGTHPVYLDTYEGVIQPLAPSGNISSISIEMDYVYLRSGRIDVVSWDPLALLTDAGTVLLRTRTFSTSDVSGGAIKVLLDPPVVTRRGPALADARFGTSSLRLEVQGGFPTAGPLTLHYTPDAPGQPVAYRWAAGYPNVLAPLPGPNPALGHLTCLGDAALQQLEVGQCVTTTTATLDTTIHTVAQRFRVPRALDIAWIELASAVYQNPYPWLPATVSIHDASAPGAPAPELPPSLVQADFPTQGYGQGLWISHAPFASPVRLEPGRDYWLAVRMQHECAVHSRALTGAESFEFTDRIGDLWVRTAEGGAWSRRSGEALCFRLIGSPASPIGAPPAPRAPFAVRVMPNPLRTDARVAVSGAQGEVRFEVLDPRGRRVSAGRSAGEWTWRATDARGAPLGAGVYFVRATDEAGRSGRERVVVVR